MTPAMLAEIGGYNASMPLSVSGRHSNWAPQSGSPSPSSSRSRSTASRVRSTSFLVELLTQCRRHPLSAMR